MVLGYIILFLLIFSQIFAYFIFPHTKTGKEQHKRERKTAEERKKKFNDNYSLRRARAEHWRKEFNTSLHYEFPSDTEEFRLKANNIINLVKNTRIPYQVNFYINVEGEEKFYPNMLLKGDWSFDNNHNEPISSHIWGGIKRNYEINKRDCETK